MKIQSVIFLMALILANKSLAQTPLTAALPKQITVTSSAELKVVPDEIYLKVQIGEYENENGSRVSIDMVRKALQNAIKVSGVNDADAMKLPDDSVQQQEGGFASLFGGTKGGGYAEAYAIKVTSVEQLAILKTGIDDYKQGIEKFEVQKLICKNEVENSKTVRANAMLAAKEKAELMCAAIGYKIMDTISIEVIESAFPGFDENQMGGMFKTLLSGFSGISSSADANITKQYNVQLKVTFAAL